MNRDYVELECDACGEILGYMFPGNAPPIVYRETLCTTCFIPETEDD